MYTLVVGLVKVTDVTITSEYNIHIESCILPYLCDKRSVFRYTIGVAMYTVRLRGNNGAAIIGMSFDLAGFIRFPGVHTVIY